MRCADIHETLTNFSKKMCVVFYVVMAKMGGLWGKGVGVRIMGGRLCVYGVDEVDCWCMWLREWVVHCTMYIYRCTIQANIYHIFAELHSSINTNSKCITCVYTYKYKDI